MKIAINAWFWDNPSVGSGQYLKYLVPSLLNADNALEITLVLPHPIQPEAAIPRLNFYVAAPPLPNPASNLAKVWFEQITFPRACRQLGADVAHVPYFGSALRPGLPTVVTIHDLIPMVLPEYRGDWRVRLYTSLAAAAAAQANIILADSEASQRDIVRRLNLPDKQVRVVYLAPSPRYRYPQPEADIAAIKKKYNLPDEFVLYLGGYDARKNVSALLHAYTWVGATLQDAFPLVLGGKLPAQETPLFPDPLRLARELGVDKYVVTPGWIAEEDLPLLYAAATVFVYPSRYEGFGLPVLEAMACGTPVVTTTAASIPELAGPAAFQIDPDDAKHLAAAILQLCTETNSNSELAARGFEQVEKFSWEKTATATLQAYRDALI